MTRWDEEDYWDDADEPGPTLPPRSAWDDEGFEPPQPRARLSPIEQAHSVEAFTFELGKVYEQAIKERELAVLANVDADLCEQVAAGLGPPAPKGTPVADGDLSPALSQIVTTPGPVAGRQVAVIADAGSDLAATNQLVKTLAKAGVTALVTAPVGGVLKAGRQSVTVERTLLTARSIEFDAIIIAAGTTPSSDIKLTVLLQEAYRHCKPIAGWGDISEQLELAGIPADEPGVTIAETGGKPFTDSLITALGMHRVWDRAPHVIASAVAPSATRAR